MCLYSLANSKNNIQRGKGECRYSKCSDYFIPKVKHWKFHFSYLGSFLFKGTLFCTILAPPPSKLNFFTLSFLIYTFLLHTTPLVRPRPIMLVCLCFNGNCIKTQEAKQETGTMESFCLLPVLKSCTHNLGHVINLWSIHFTVCCDPYIL